MMREANQNVPHDTAAPAAHAIMRLINRGPIRRATKRLWRSLKSSLWVRCRSVGRPCRPALTSMVQI
jgi:hypothetical protein